MILIDIIISYITSFFIPYLGFFPIKEILIEFGLPKFLYSFANFDGAQYLSIVKSGYFTYQQAYFPLYPLLVRYLAPIFAKNYLITALLISNISFIGGLYIFKKYLGFVYHPKLGSEPVPNSIRESEIRSRNPLRGEASKFGMTGKYILWTIILLISFPTSFFFGAVYTEGLFFFLFISALYYLKKERVYIAAFFAFFASLTKLIGFFLTIFFILKLIKNFKLKIKNYGLFIASLSPLIGLGIYSFYLWRVHGDPLFFLTSQSAFGAHRTSSLIFLPQVYFRYLKIFFTAAWNFQYFIALFEFLTFNFILIVLVLDLIKIMGGRKRREGIFWQDPLFLGLNLFSFANLLLPTFTGTLSSIPRYALFSLSFFLFLAQIKNTKMRIAIAFIFAIFHIVMLGFFIQGYFIS